MQRASRPSAAPAVSLADERPRLVRLCTRLTGDPDAAEDLAQETLVEAHRAVGRLRDPSRHPEWLSGMARNVCRRWSHRRGRDLALGVLRSHQNHGHDDDWPEEIADGFDVEAELERDELAGLVDRALSRLPARARAVLIEHYLLERPQAEIGRRLGVSEAAVTMRLQRAKRALRDVLATDLRDEAAAYGLVPRSVPGGQVTRIWCPLCGKRRLVGTFAVVDPAGPTRRLDLACPGCFAGSELAFASSGGVAMFGAVQGYRAALLRALGWCRDRLLDLPAGRRIDCARCGAPATIEVRADAQGPSALRGVHRVFESCLTCGQVNDVYLAGLAGATPAGRLFWRDHPRAVMVPEYRVDAGGVSAIVTGLSAVGGAARLEVVFSLDRLRVLGIHRT